MKKQKADSEDISKKITANEPSEKI
jgi:hypothetical protein